MSNLRSRLAGMNKKISSIKKAIVKRKQMKIASKKDEENFNKFVIDELNKHGISFPTKEDHMKEYDISEEEWGGGEDYPSILVEFLLEGAVAQGAKFENKKIDNIVNDAGNIIIYFKDENNDEDELDFFGGFEYASYTGDKKWLDEGLKNIKKIQW